MVLLQAKSQIVTSVATYNIRVDVPFDTANSWEKRKEAVTDLLRFYHPDIFGLQEGLFHQLNYICEHLEKYRYAGSGRDDGKTAGEYSCIFYNTEKYELLTDSTFWLSETPDKPSKGWDAAYTRICTYALLRYRSTGYKVWVINSHLDNAGPQARLNGVELIISRLKKMIDDSGYPVILMGDLNSEAHEAPVKTLSSFLSDSRIVSKEKPYGPEATFNGFNSGSLPEKRIDFIFVSSLKIEVENYIVIDDRYEMKYPSDHFPVMVQMKLK